MSAELHRFMDDNDGHTYLIPLSLVDKFDEWLHWDYVLDGGAYMGPDFDEYLCHYPTNSK